MIHRDIKPLRPTRRSTPPDATGVDSGDTTSSGEIQQLTSKPSGPIGDCAAAQVDMKFRPRTLYDPKKFIVE